MSRDINKWVYDGEGGICDNFIKKNNKWTETNLKTYDDQLGCVPPIRMTSNAFMVGECYTEDYYAVFVELNNRFFGKHARLKDYNPTKFNDEIRNQFGL